MIEEAKLTVCSECSKHGTPVWEESKPASTLQPKPKTALMHVKPRQLKNRDVGKTREIVEASLELVEDFDVKVRQAREKMGLTHEDLGRKINEKVSVLRKIETRKIKPDDKIAAKLERALKIKLLMPAPEEKTSRTVFSKPSSSGITLGDLMKLKKDEGKTEEKT